MPVRRFYMSCLFVALIAQSLGCVDLPEDIRPPPTGEPDSGADGGEAVVDAGAPLEDAGPGDVDLCIGPVNLPYFDEAPDGSDLAIAEIRDLASECVFNDCIEAVDADDDALGCTTDCVEEAAPEELSGTCLDCFAEEALCIFDSCVAECLGSSHQACLDCRTALCTPAFSLCSGLL